MCADSPMEHTQFHRSPHRGFTLIEFIIVFGIVTLVITAGFLGLSAFRNVQALNAAQDTVLSTMERARSKTVASEGSQQYGVHLDADKIVIFPGATYNASNTANESLSVPGGIEIANATLSSWPDISFARLTGQASGTGDIAVRPKGNPAQGRTIRIYEFSQASGPYAYPSQLGTRVTDTRHVHYDLGWSIQAATTLTLTFTKSDSSTQIETIAMSCCFSGGPPPTSFDWQGIIVVDGVSQTLRIHTHTLSVSNTILSVQRDLMQNTKAVKVSISPALIGNGEIVSYAQSGAITVLSSGGVATIQ